MAIVYQHIRLDTNNIFYIGIGKSEERAFAPWGRSSFWNKIVAKSKYKVEILHKNISIQEASEIERNLIKFYGRKKLGLGELVNITEGGEGVRGTKTERILQFTPEGEFVRIWNSSYSIECNLGITKEVLEEYKEIDGKIFVIESLEST